MNDSFAQSAIKALCIAAMTCSSLCASLVSGHNHQAQRASSTAEPAAPEDPGSIGGSPNIRRPVVVADPSFIDFGEAPPGTAVETQATITNTGDRPVRIARIGTNCSCARASVSEQTLAQGASAKLSLTAAAPSQPGRALAPVATLHFIDSGIGPLEVRTAVRARAEIETALIGVSEEEDALKVTLEFRSHDMTPFRILGLPQLEKMEPDRTVIVPLRIPLDLEGRVPRTVGVRTDHPNQPLVRVELERIIPLPLSSEGSGLRFQRREVAAIPSVARLGRVPSGSETLFEIRLPGWGEPGLPHVETPAGSSVNLRLAAASRDGDAAVFVMGVRPHKNAKGRLRESFQLIGLDHTTRVRIDARVRRTLE